MARIAFCLPALPSHAAVHAALARALAQRGHECLFVGADRLEALARQHGTGFAGLGFREIDLRRAGLGRTLLATARATQGWVRHGPEALARLAPDFVVADQAEPGASLAAEAAGLARATLAAALPLDRDEAIPPPFVGWPMLEGEAGRRRNRGGWRVADALLTLQSRALAAGCRRHGLPLRPRLSDWISPVLDMRQLPACLDFPHHAGPGAQAVGRLRDGTACDVTVDGADGDGQPLVFASLGTLQGGRAVLFAAIAAAAEAAGVRLMLAHGGGLGAAEAAALPGRPLVRDYWPQQAVLARADACITHAGMNTVLDCVAARVPMVAIPLAFEQPATAARLAWHGVAQVVPRRHATPATIRDALVAVLRDPAFRDALRRPAAAMDAAGGTVRAVALIEDALARDARLGPRGAAAMQARA